MPYSKTSSLPKNVKNSLPTHALEIYLAAYNNAWDEYSEAEDRRGNETREEVSHKVAWAAVKRQYEKVGDRWRRKARRR